MERVFFVSFFMVFLLVGNYVFIDYSDGVGMNFMDFYSCIWFLDVLDVSFLFFIYFFCVYYKFDCVLLLCIFKF